MYCIIYQLELFAITIAFKVFGPGRPSLQGRVIILRSDNLAVVNSINKMSSHLEAPMDLLWELTLTCMSLQILAKAVHIPGIHKESDLISRGRLSDFLKENPKSHGQMKELTSNLWPPSWKPSMQRLFSGRTEFQKGNRGQSISSRKYVTGKTCRWN